MDYILYGTDNEQRLAARKINFFWNGISFKRWKCIGCYMLLFQIIIPIFIKRHFIWRHVGQSPCPTAWYGSGGVLKLRPRDPRAKPTDLKILRLTLPLCINKLHNLILLYNLEVFKFSSQPKPSAFCDIRLHYRL